MKKKKKKQATGWPSSPYLATPDCEASTTPKIQHQPHDSIETCFVPFSLYRLGPSISFMVMLRYGVRADYAAFDRGFPDGVY